MWEVMVSTSKNIEWFDMELPTDKLKQKLKLLTSPALMVKTWQKYYLVKKLAIRSKFSHFLPTKFSLGSVQVSEMNSKKCVFVYIDSKKCTNILWVWNLTFLYKCPNIGQENMLNAPKKYLVKKSWWRYLVV